VYAAVQLIVSHGRRKPCCEKFQCCCEIPRNSLSLFSLKTNQRLLVHVVHTAAAGGNVMKILLAIDGSPCSDAAVAEVARRPWPQGSALKVLNVQETPMPPTPETWAISASYFEEIEAALKKQGQRTIDNALQKLKTNKTLSLSSLLVFGSPRPVVLDEAESWGADLIVVGSHGYSAWKRFLLGSVSQAVVSHAKCSVEVVRCPAVDETSNDESSDRSKGR
jgi:nucleotide-binding universal stress UspA family protein